MSELKLDWDRIRRSVLSDYVLEQDIKGNEKLIATVINITLAYVETQLNKS